MSDGSYTRFRIMKLHAMAYLLDKEDLQHVCDKAVVDGDDRAREVCLSIMSRIEDIMDQAV